MLIITFGFSSIKFFQEPKILLVLAYKALWETVSLVRDGDIEL